MCSIGLGDSAAGANDHPAWDLNCDLFLWKPFLATQRLEIRETHKRERGRSSEACRTISVIGLIDPHRFHSCLMTTGRHISLGFSLNIQPRKTDITLPRARKYAIVVVLTTYKVKRL